MSASFHVLSMVVCTVLLMTGVVLAKPTHRIQELADTPTYVDVVGDIDGTHPLPQKAAEDTTWIADWSFDAGGACTDAGWQKIDNRIFKHDDQIYWNVNGDFDGQGGIVGNAAVCGNHDLCCTDVEGYDNNWYQAVRITYSGSGYLSFDYLLDSELADLNLGTLYDYLAVELDSACASFYLTDQNEDGVVDNPTLRPKWPDDAWSYTRLWSYAAKFRSFELEEYGLNMAGRVDSLPLTDFGVQDTHCLYVAFFSDGGWSPCDGLSPTTLGAAVVIDNLILEGVDSPLHESFESTVDPRITYVDLWDDLSFGDWGRVFEYVTDNDLCAENRTCSWLWTDDTTPTVANNANMAFGPGAFVVRNWLDNIIVSPWVSLAQAPGAVGLILSFREFRGNYWDNSRIVRNWSVRGKRKVENTNTPAPGDSCEVLSSWGHAFSWNSLSDFSWQTRLYDMTPYFDVTSTEVQVGFHVSDWQWVHWSAPGPPELFNPGPGPFIDRVRIGRQLVTGPLFNEGLDSRYQAQDAFPTEIHPFIPPGTGEHHRPLTVELKPGGGGRFGTAAFSAGQDKSYGGSPNIVTGDSITIEVLDVRGAGGISNVEWYGAIVSGPHEGKAPPPWSVGANGFFLVPPDSSRDQTTGQVVENHWFIDLDDDYFRGGDVLYYFWLAEDAQGAVSSDPEGLGGVPNSIEEAEALTGGLLEVSFLPAIKWAPGYLARISADTNGKLEPTQEELANSSQANCILYNELSNTRRLSGDANRTSFMYTLDQLGYRNHYDVYDVLGSGNMNNQLGGRATVAQATGYALIIQDSGSRVGSFILPDGSNLDGEKVDQTGWYRDWLETAAMSEAETATLWLVGSRVAEIVPNNSLITNTMGVVFVASDQGLNSNPDIDGQTSFTFENGSPVDFSNDLFSLDGGCPDFPLYNAIDASGTAAVTHSWKDPSSGLLGDGAVVMNTNESQSWNTIMMAIPWFDIADPSGSPPSSPPPERALMAKILGAVLPQECEAGDPSTDVGEPGDDLSNLPKRTALYQNMPNPFNPTTTIRFDLSREGHVSLRIYDVAGRLVRSVIDQKMEPGRYPMTWHGLNDAGRRVPSGVYLYQLVTDEFSATRKLVVMK